MCIFVVSHYRDYWWPAIYWVICRRYDDYVTYGSGTWKCNLVAYCYSGPKHYERIQKVTNHSALKQIASDIYRRTNLLPSIKHGPSGVIEVRQRCGPLISPKHAQMNTAYLVHLRHICIYPVFELNCSNWNNLFQNTCKIYFCSTEISQ